MGKINVEIVTPEKSEICDLADAVRIPGAQGEFGVLVDHAPMIANMKRGIVEIHSNDSIKKFFVDGGFVEVTETKCNILAEKSEDVTSLDAKELHNLIVKSN